MAKTLTGADCILAIAVAGLFDAPVQLQGFATDDVTEMEQVKPTEVMPGVDGKLSGGWVYVPVEQMVTLQADSDSNDIFDQWNAAQKQGQTTFTASGLIIMRNSLKTTWTLTKGFLTTYTPMPKIGKLAQPRKYGVTWEAVEPAPA